jgi:hypothetical protein
VADAKWVSSKIRFFGGEIPGDSIRLTIRVPRDAATVGALAAKRGLFEH